MEILGVADSFICGDVVAVDNPVTNSEITRMMLNGKHSLTWMINHTG